jgi:phosphate/sulfate permease
VEIGAIIVILLALAFDFTNGFHDEANSIATVVSTRVLSPRYAVIWAAFFNFVAFLIFSTHVANTIAKGVVMQDALTVGVIFAGLVGAIAWNLLTFWLGLPTSSSHALVGGIAGAAVALNGFDVLISEGLHHRGLHSAVAFDRPCPRAAVDRHHPMGVSSQHRHREAQQGLPTGPARLGGRLQPWAWRE